VNQARKDAGLQIADTITLHLGTETELLQKAIAAQKENIGREVQAKAWSDTPLSAAVHSSEVKVDGFPLRVQFAK
jgi:hypothetical protein